MLLTTRARTSTAFAIVRVLLVTIICCSSYRSIAASNYLEYYRAISTAEEAIVNKQYSEALRLYEATFSQFDYSNPIDCYVAAQVASYIGQGQRCAALLRRGISFGLPIKTIAGNPHIAPYIGSSSLSNATTDSCWNVYQSHIDTKARAAAIALIQRDQSIVQRLPNRGIYTRGRTLKHEYNQTWDSLVAEVISLTKSSGFPAQRIIGTMNGDDSLFSIGPNSVYVYYILIHHGNVWPQIGELLWTELQKGNITPQMFGAIAEHSNSNPDSGCLFMALRPCDTRECKKSLAKNRQQINANRSRVALCSYEVMERKYDATHAYQLWMRNSSREKKPVFDFQPDLHFSGLESR